jgi:uncharacterized protein with HEPN domain
MDRDRSTLLDIAKAARLTVQFVEGSDRSRFLEDARTQSAVLHQLLVIGEATKRFPRNSGERMIPSPGSSWPACGTS